MSIGEAGELVVRGPQVMQGYWNNEAETRAVLRDGWLYTGDIVRRDEDGFFFFMDRKKDVIKPWGDGLSTRGGRDPVSASCCAEAVVVGTPDPITEKR